MKIYNDDVMKAVRQSIGCTDENDTSKDEKIMRMPKEEVFENRQAKRKNKPANAKNTAINM